MTAYLVRRLAGAFLVLAVLILAAFIATHYIGDPAFLLVDREFLSEAERQEIIRQGGFDRPFLAQFLEYLSSALRGDFGTSIWQNRPAAAVVLERIPRTALLGAASLALTFLVAIPAALIAASRPPGPARAAITTAATALASLPAFWLALGLVYLVAVEWRLLPTGGYGSWRHLVLPAIALAAGPIGRYTLILESAVARDLRQHYVRTARAKGLSESAVLVRHLLPNAAILGLTLLGGELIILLNGTLLIETIFSWPGVGEVAYSAVTRRDLPVLMAAVIYVAAIVLLVNLLVDLAYTVVDPRVRLQ